MRGRRGQQSVYIIEASLFERLFDRSEKGDQSAEPLRRFIVEEHEPGGAQQSDAQILDWVRRRAGSIFHPVGTCAMGPDEADSVVDARLKVHGLDKSGSNLTLVQTPLPPSFGADNVTKDPEKFFAKPGLKIVKSESGDWNGHKGIKLEMEAGGNRIWVHMIFAKPWLYQLVALQSSQSSEDFGPQRNQFFGSFQFTRKK